MNTFSSFEKQHSQVDYHVDYLWHTSNELFMRNFTQILLDTRHRIDTFCTQKISLQLHYYKLIYELEILQYQNQSPSSAYVTSSYINMTS